MVAAAIGTTGEARLRDRVARLHQHAGDLDRATEEYTAAIELARARTDRFIAGIATYGLAGVARERTRHEEAERLYREALALLRGHRRGEAIVRGEYGIFLLGLGRHEEARTLLDSSAREHRAHGDARGFALVVAAHGALEAERGELVAAQRSIDEARDHVADGQPVLAALVRVEGGHLALARAREALAHGDLGASARARAQAEADLAASESAVRIGSFDDAPRALSLDVRDAAHRLRRALEAFAPATVSLVVAHDGSWFAPPGGSTCSLASRASLRLLLAALADQRLALPGGPLDPERLFAVGWPAQRATPQARRNRVRVALSTLRAHGLSDLITSTPQGVYLDPQTPLVRAAAPRGARPPNARP
jgi:Tfp pilus assembly protein PilF